MNTTDKARNKLKSILKCYDNYIDNTLAGDFAFNVVEKIEALEKENKELKEALTEIKDCANEHSYDFEKYNDFVYLTAKESLERCK